MNSYFVICSQSDSPLYEFEQQRDSIKVNSRHLNQFIVHSALDIVDELMQLTQHTYLKARDSACREH